LCLSHAFMDPSKGILLIHHVPRNLSPCYSKRKAPQMTGFVVTILTRERKAV
jgi:hypothetical protein